MSDPRLTDPTKRISSLAVPRSTIIIDSVQDEGIFGKIYTGKYHQKIVTIKTTKGM